MNSRILCFVFLLCAVFMGSCTMDDEVVSGVSGDEVQRVTVSLPPLSIEEDDASTRAYLVKEGSTYHIRWSAGDVMGVYPASGSQVDFPIKEEFVGTNNAEFDGGGWALKVGYRYAAYFPYSYSFTDKTAIPLDYMGQKQVGNDNRDYIDRYNYFASERAIVAEGPSLDFKIYYLGHLLRFAFTMPDPGNFTKLRLRSSGTPFAKTARLDISGEYPEVEVDETSDVMTMSLEGVRTTNANELVTIYMWISPRDFSGSALTAELITDEGKIYRTTMKSQDYPAGNATGFTRPNATYGIEYVGDEPASVDFADSAVKSICVANWDTDGDGELSLEEAAAVADLNTATTRSGDGGSVFTGNTEITSFDELSYFTGVTAIPANAFLGCENLTSVTIPENVETIGEAAFKGCWNLEEITLLPTEVPTLEGDVSSVFVSTNDCPILVPEESLDAYVNAWGLYADRIDPDLEVLTNANLIAAAENYSGQQFTKNEDGSVTLDEGNRAIVESVTYLYLGEKNDPTICDEIGYFVNLEELYCYYNQITALDVSKNTALKELYCDSNLLTSLDVSNNTALKRLGCCFNQLTTLDVSKNTALESLNCYHNQLTSLNTSNNVSLMILACYGNPLNTLDVSKNTALEMLVCSSNQLTTLDVSKNTALNYLGCGDNQLTSLDVSHNTALTELSLGNNQLTSLDVSNNIALERLSCGTNQLASLDLSHNTALTELWCNGNQLTSLNVSNNLALTKLSCYANQISTLDISENTELDLSNVQVGNQLGELTLYVNGTQNTQTLAAGHNQNVTVLQKDLPEGITFADETVKQLCLANWDTNRDGVLTLEEAAAVTNLGTVFRRSAIVSFEEIQFFTGLTSIGDMAFNGCYNLTSITIPNGVISIGRNAFGNCTSLSSIFISENVTSIGDMAFNNCPALSSIIVDPDNTIYDSRNNCNAIIETSTNNLLLGCSHTEIPNTVTSIGLLAFAGQTNLTSITIPNSVTFIDDSAFSGTGLTSIYIPKSLTGFSYNPFDNCVDLASIVVDSNHPYLDSRNNCNAICDGDELLVGCKNTVIPSDILTIGHGAFQGCSITSFSIPSNVKVISHFAFNGCSELETITISEGVTEIRQFAFAYCYSLSSFTIPSTVTAINGDAFEYCI